jgi:tetratricopeptide (TPR) repeat protein
MVKIRKPKKENDDILPIENKEALNDTLNKSEEFINNNKNKITLTLGVIVFIIFGFSIFSYLKDNQNISAQEEMFQAVYYFEKDSLVQALNGDGNNYGFLEIIDEYSLSDAANLSKFYAGAAYLKLGNYQNAINYLSEFSSSDLLVQARAYSLIGDAYVEISDFDNAIYYFKKASSENPNEYFTPNYLLKLALVYEELGDFELALDAYEEIIEDFKNSPEYQTSVKNKSRIEGLLL